MGLPSDPEDLVQGMSDYLREIGIGTSFLDENEVVVRGARPPMWQLMTRALINPYSFERRIFQENLLPKIEETKLYQEAKKRQELRVQKKAARMQMLQGTGDKARPKESPGGQPPFQRAASQG